MANALPRIGREVKKSKQNHRDQLLQLPTAHKIFISDLQAGGLDIVSSFRYAPQDQLPLLLEKQNKTKQKQKIYYT